MLFKLKDCVGIRTNEYELVMNKFVLAIKRQLLTMRDFQ